MYKYTVQQSDTAGLNSIVQKLGFKNYKEAGINSVPSGDFNLIRPGEVIDIPNYNPNNIKPIQKTDPVLASSDGQAEFRDLTGKLGTQVGSLTPIKKDETKVSEVTPFGDGTKKADGTTSTTGDPLMDKLNKWESDQTTKFEADATARKAEYDKLFTTTLANIDSAAAATIENVKQTYEKRITEQRRINQLNVDRIKAYGLGNGGAYTPISFGDAVSIREQEAAEKISGLEKERTNLIAQAEAAREQGRIGALRENMKTLDEVNKRLNENLARVSSEAEKQYNLLRTLRKEEETKQKEALDKMKERLASIAPKYLDEYDTMDEKGQDAFITKISQQTGLDYATVFATMQNASNAEVKKKAEKTSQDLTDEAKRASIEASRASTAKTRADIEVKSTQKKMDKEVPTSFKNDADFTKKRIEFINKWGKEGQQYWDAIFLKADSKEFDYVTEGGGNEDEEDPLRIGV